jgi:hypothetical protein
MRLLPFILFLLAVFPSAIASGKQNCEKALDAIPTFDSKKKMFLEIHEFYKKYDSCMDAGISEGMAGVITETLDQNWSQLKELERILKKEPLFKKFILSSISPAVTGQETDVGRIIIHAKKRCPKGLEGLCKEIQKTCEESLRSE